MAAEKCKQKMLLAVVQGEDYPETVDALNRRGFFATVLSSTGGFLKKRSITLMIGVEAHQVDAVLEVLRESAGQRKQTTYSNLSMSTGSPNPAIPMMPVHISVGGVVTRNENYASLHQHGVSVHITRNLDALPKDGRPVSQSTDLHELWAKREPLYQAFADITADNRGSIEETVEYIIKELEAR